MKDQYNIKDKKVDIYERVECAPDQDAPDWKTEKYKKVLSGIWAYTRQLSENIIVQQRQALIEESKIETRLFILNYHEEVKPTSVIFYKGEYYKINRVTTSDDYNTDIIAYVNNYDIPDNMIISEI